MAIRIREGTMRKRVDDNMYNIGSNIRTARKRADLTQEELSERLGVTPQYLSDLERGLVGTSISTLIEKFQRRPKHKAEIVERYIDFVFEIMDMDPNQRTNK